MDVDIKNIIAAYQTATESEKTLLCALFPDAHLSDTQTQADNRPITERIKTFENACEYLGLSVESLCDMWAQGGIIEPDEIAYQKLRLITTALNEGWTPKFTSGEYRWYPWFSLYDLSDLSELTEDWKLEHAYRPTTGYVGDYCGFASASSNTAPSNALAYFGSRLCYKSEALAEYSGRQFADLWADYYLIRK